jgi:hypothetical protein
VSEKRGMGHPIIFGWTVAGDPPGGETDCYLQGRQFFSGELRGDSI